jgi:hypothetical protein
VASFKYNPVLVLKPASQARRPSRPPSSTHRSSQRRVFQAASASRSTESAMRPRRLAEHKLFLTRSPAKLLPIAIYPLPHSMTSASHLFRIAITHCLSFIGSSAPSAAAHLRLRHNSLNIASSITFLHASFMTLVIFTNRYKAIHSCLRKSFTTIGATHQSRLKVV